MNKTSELVSVIVPVFKTEQYLDQCVESIVRQTYYNLEIILIDDGSPDQCPEICDKWAQKDSRITVIHKENGGVSRARNVGIEKAKGRYIVFIDSDDFLEPVYIECLYRALCDTGADISECGYTRSLDFQERECERTIMSQPVIQTAEEALWIWSHPEHNEFNLVIWNKMYRCELIKEIRYAEGYDGGEDTLFTCQAFINCRKIAHIDNELYHWRDTPNSASKKFPDNPLQSVEMHLLALDYLDQSYPSIARECKILICRMVNGFFYSLQYEIPLKCKREAKERMLSYRRRIHFTAKEWGQCTLKDKIIIICSGTPFVGHYIRFRHFWNIVHS